MYKLFYSILYFNLFDKLSAHFTLHHNFFFSLKWIQGKCTPAYCSNNGNCKIENGDAKCVCYEGFIGVHCETGITKFNCIPSMDISRIMIRFRLILFPSISIN
jgi:hypothetical protein